MTRLIVCIAACLVGVGSLGGQPVSFTVRGDTAKGSHSCGAREGVQAISQWFAAFNTADSSKLDEATASRFVFSTGRFIHGEPFFVTRDIPALLRYALKRSRHRERLRVQEVWFNGWRDGDLQFGPIYFMRSADDLGKDPRPGVGKGAYRCGDGVEVLNVGPRPDLDPGPGK